MPDQLLDRQLSLLEHLTGGAGIFGAARGLSNAPALHGLDLGLLHLEARFSHEKRMQKIEWVLTRTLALLGGSRAAVVREFVDACPPTSIRWLDNARQFHDLLKARWRQEQPAPPWLPDIAAYEIAYAKVRAGENEDTAAFERASEYPSGSIRRSPGAILLRCAYDIGPVLAGAGEHAPTRRETLLAITMLPGTEEPMLSELSGDLFELLEMLDGFVEPALFRTAGADILIKELAGAGLIEVHP
jgi:hypothetical protein